MHPLRSTTTRPTDPAPVPVRHNPLWKRKTASVSRWLHIYLSMFSFAVLLFFAVTGLTLNHAEWFNGQERTVQAKGSIDARWLAPQVAKLEIVEALRRTHHISGAVHDFRIDDTQLSVSFKGPGYTADASIDRKTGAYDLTETRMGFWAIVNDLHKGRDSGAVWGVVIDICAVLMTLVSLTGFVLIFFMIKRRFSGLLLFAIGMVVAVFAWWKWVP